MPAYKDKTRGTWYAKFNYTDWTGSGKQKMQRGFKTQRAAKEFERDFLSKSSGNPDMLFSSLVELYMEDSKTRLKPTTYENKSGLIYRKILPFFKDMPIDTIEPSAIRKWQNTLLSDEKKFSPTYLMTIHSQLSAIFNYAVKYYKLPSNPARICGSIGKSHAEAMKFWTLDEFNQFIKFSNNPEFTMIYELLFFTGIRIGECLALTLDDFDFEKKLVRINKNYVRLHGEDIVMSPKTPKSNRVVTIPDFLCESMKAYAAKLYSYESSVRLFNCHRGSVNNRLQAICKSAGVKQIRLHDLRHSHASLLIHLGFTSLLISERLGHDNIETTLRTYSHLYPDMHAEVANKLQELI